MEKEIVYRKKEIVSKYFKKLQQIVQKMSLTFLLQSVLYEGMDTYEKSIECLKYKAVIRFFIYKHFNC